MKMMPKRLIRFSTHRSFYCYMILSVWIILLIAGMYKYIGNSNSMTPLGFLNRKRQYEYSSLEDEEAVKFRKYKQRCTPLANLKRQDEGGILDGWKLHGVLLVVRHGDRGPLSHVRGISPVNCGVQGDQLLNRYRSFLYNSSTSNPSGPNHMYWNKLGPFHGFALLPPIERSCLLGQLTFKGIAQMLHVGEVLHQIYAHPLGLLLRPQQTKSYLMSTPHSLLNSDEVVIYTTRYRRTFQSAMALLFSFLPSEKWLSLNIRESHSMAFCFADCACPQAETLRKKLNWMNTDYLAQHPAVSRVLLWISAILLHHSPNGSTNPNEVVDAVLTFLCHDSPLPCRRASVNAPKLTTTETTTVDLNDIINIDQDDTAANLVETPVSVISEESAHDDRTAGCIEPHQVAALLSYTNWQSSMEVKNIVYKQIGLLRAYGMIRHLVSHMLKMISGDRTKFVLYSGHDWTLQYLTAALGIQTESTIMSYAARLTVEVYKSEKNTDYYFRMLYNGKDVTRQIDFCEGGKSLRVTRDSRGNKADLCPIENIIRFLHEDYFTPLNATNFKDACTAKDE